MIHARSLPRPFIFCILLSSCLASSPLCTAAAQDDAQEEIARSRGDVVWLDFWASWCVPCRHSFPWMNAMQDKYGPLGLTIVAVNLDAERSDADRFLATMPAGFRIQFDP